MAGNIKFGPDIEDLGTGEEAIGPDGEANPDWWEKHLSASPQRLEEMTKAVQNYVSRASFPNVSHDDDNEGEFEPETVSIVTAPQYKSRKPHSRLRWYPTQPFPRRFPLHGLSRLLQPRIQTRIDRTSWIQFTWIDELFEYGSGG